jgi:hypothetical protein
MGPLCTLFVKKKYYFKVSKNWNNSPWYLCNFSRESSIASGLHKNNMKVFYGRRRSNHCIIIWTFCHSVWPHTIFFFLKTYMSKYQGNMYMQKIILIFFWNFQVAFSFFKEGYTWSHVLLCISDLVVGTYEDPLFLWALQPSFLKYSPHFFFLYDIEHSKNRSIVNSGELWWGRRTPVLAGGRCLWLAGG